MLKTIGLFSEIVQSNKILCSLQEKRGKLSQFDSEKIADYLSQGIHIAVVMGAEQDVFDRKNLILGASSILSDGNWIWRGDLFHYVRFYNIQIEEEFMNSIRLADYKYPFSDESILMNWEQIYKSYVEQSGEISRSNQEKLKPEKPD